MNKAEGRRKRAGGRGQMRVNKGFGQRESSALTAVSPCSFIL